MLASDMAAEAQRRAADPAASAWVSANAGSGKTRVLIDRVARLMLAGSEPQRILCLTYTKAAAAEMQVRLFDRLGAWAMLPDADLRRAMSGLGLEGPITAPEMAQARRLFARATDAPGGLRIQTIHSFCGAILQQFPLESGVSPDFALLDDRSAGLLRTEVFESLAETPDTTAFDGLMRRLGEERIDPLLKNLVGNRAAFRSPLTRGQAMAAFGLPAGFDMAALLARVVTGGEAEVVARLLPLLAGSSTNDRKDGNKLARADLRRCDMETLEALESVLLTGDGARAPFTARIGVFPTKPLRQGAAAPLMPALDALMARVEAAREPRLALAAAEATLALHGFARAFLPEYERRKQRRGALDFDDLTERAGALLSDASVAQWVLFRLDGGIDHILVDEAQDTSPGQWAVIERLAEEFTAGLGPHGQERTVFVVGDKKQSIYSFQGADLDKFEAMGAHFTARFAAIQRPMQTPALSHSYRSAEAILKLVDATLDERAHAGLGGATEHHPTDLERPGRVDLWPLVEPEGKPDDDDWTDPVDRIGQRHHSVRLAERIAGEIRRLIDAGTRITTRNGTRRLTEGDILILVQRRRSGRNLFAEIIRALKKQGLAVAGADRLRLGAELAVRDITSLLSFLDLPEDDLALAECLRSPLIGLSEAGLYALAAGRKATLWQAMRDAGKTHADALAMLHDLRDQADFLRPYDLIERLLVRHDGRRRLIGRLGAEAEDGIDELLAQALAYERAEVPGLTGFLTWLQTDEVEVKRRLEGGGDVIRVMTVHGAKGLEAPLVILPDTLADDLPERSEILTAGQGPAVLRGVRATMPGAIADRMAAAREAQRRERMRLLYVAMTRAESWLIVCGAGALKEPKVGGESEPKPPTWYELVGDGMARAGAARQEGAEAPGFGPVQRFALGDWPLPAPGAFAERPPLALLPDWARRVAKVPADTPPLSPSDLGGAKALPGESDLADGMRYGRMLHALLEHLPGLPVADRAEAAGTLLARGLDHATEAEMARLLATAENLIANPDLAAVFAPDTLAEVEIAARLPELGGRMILGAIDRLILGDGFVRAVDFKSNALIPATPAEVPDGILRQMGAYAAALALIFPGRRVETAILWTRSAHLMPLAPEMVRAALVATP